MLLGSLKGAVASAALAAGVSLVSVLQMGDLTRVSTLARHYISTYITTTNQHELLLKVHNILDSAVSKWVGNSAHILAHVFNSVCRQCCEIWASQFPFLHSLKDVIPPSKAGLYDHINWSLAQAQQSSMGCLSLSLLRGVARPGHGLGSISQCRRDLCQDLVVLPWQRGLTWRQGMQLIQVARSLLVAVSPPVLLILGGKGSMGVSAHDVSQSSVSSSSSSAVFFFGLVCF